MRSTPLTNGAVFFTSLDRNRDGTYCLPLFSHPHASQSPLLLAQYPRLETSMSNLCLDRSWTAINESHFPEDFYAKKTQKIIFKPSDDGSGFASKSHRALTTDKRVQTAPWKVPFAPQSNKLHMIPSARPTAELSVEDGTLLLGNGHYPTKTQI